MVAAPTSQRLRRWTRVSRPAPKRLGAPGSLGLWRCFLGGGLPVPLIATPWAARQAWPRGRKVARVLAPTGFPGCNGPHWETAQGYPGNLGDRRPAVMAL